MDQPWWTRPDDYPGMEARCRCGHGFGSHFMDTGRCCRGHYGPYGRWQADGCPCMKFRAESIAQTDLLDELLADAEPPPT